MKLNICIPKLPAWGVQPISFRGSHKEQTSRTGVAIQYHHFREWWRVAMPHRMGSARTGTTIQRTSQSTKLNTLKTAAGFTGLRKVMVKYEAILNAGWLL